jgi:protein tyrosine phosphatase
MNEKEHFVVRRLRLTLNSSGAHRESVELQHFQYTEWPDFGVPTSTIPFLAFLNAIRATGLLEQPNPPTVIHCSAGIGRSGAFLLVDVVLRMV